MWVSIWLSGVRLESWSSPLRDLASIPDCHQSKEVVTRKCVQHVLFTSLHHLSWENGYKKFNFRQKPFKNKHNGDIARLTQRHVYLTFISGYLYFTQTRSILAFRRRSQLTKSSVAGYRQIWAWLYSAHPAARARSCAKFIHCECEAEDPVLQKHLRIHIEPPPPPIVAKHPIRE